MQGDLSGQVCVVAGATRGCGRAIAAMASAPNVYAKSGKILATWNLYKEYGFVHLDGRQPDWQQNEA